MLHSKYDKPTSGIQILRGYAWCCPGYSASHCITGPFVFYYGQENPGNDVSRWFLSNNRRGICSHLESMGLRFTVGAKRRLNPRFAGAGGVTAGTDRFRRY